MSRDKGVGTRSHFLERSSFEQSTNSLRRLARCAIKLFLSCNTHERSATKTPFVFELRTAFDERTSNKERRKASSRSTDHFERPGSVSDGRPGGRIHEREIEPVCPIPRDGIRSGAHTGWRGNYEGCHNVSRENPICPKSWPMPPGPRFDIATLVNTATLFRHFNRCRRGKSICSNLPGAPFPSASRRELAFRAYTRLYARPLTISDDRLSLHDRLSLLSPALSSFLPSRFIYSEPSRFTL